MKKCNIKNVFVCNLRRVVICGILLLTFIATCNLQPATCNLYAQGANKEEETLYVAKKAFEDGFYEVAISLLERFLKNYPASPKLPQVKLLIGQCYFHQNRFLDALAKFEELLSQPSAKNIRDEILYWIGEVHFRGNAFTRAGQYYKMIIDESPKSAYAAASFYSLGWCLFQESDFSGAMKYFQIVEEKFPNESQARDSSFKIVECLYNLKEYSRLKDKIKSYLKIYSKDTVHLPYLYFYLAEANFYLDNFTESIDGYTKVLLNTSDTKMRALS
ncbi:MAG: tetratricopeptide repeat protein [Candidatus Omnitrophota bacterium]|nr:tetratricopeptide repeat protein [Candidatus Omnitrophota bacterium]